MLNGTPAQQQMHVTDKMPQTNPAVANRLVRGDGIGGAMVLGANVGDKLPEKSPANSGNKPIKFQSAAPSAKTGVRCSTRPSAIHCRICSAPTGPYSLPSCPMILYMVIHSLSSAEYPVSAQTPRFAFATNSIRTFAIAPEFFFCASAKASRKFSLPRNNK